MFNRQVELIKRIRLFDNFFKVDQLTVRHTTYHGEMSEPISRLVLDRGDGVAALVYNSSADILYFTEQFRAPTWENGSGWLLELPAGMIDSGESPEVTIMREIEEEIGFRPAKAELIGTFYLTPGGSSERIFLFYCEVNDTNRVSKGGGLASESEDIKTIELSSQETFKRLGAGEWADAKTIIAIQWFRLRNSLTNSS